MGILGKLAFWKHEDSLPRPESLDTGYNPDLGKDSLGLNDQTGLGNIGQQGLDNAGMGSNFPSQNTGLGSSPNLNQPSNLEPIEEAPFSQPSAFGRLKKGLSKNQSDNNLSTNLELVSSKLDTLKAMLDTLSHKIDKIEKIAEAEEEKDKYPY